MYVLAVVTLENFSWGGGGGGGEGLVKNLNLGWLLQAGGVHPSKSQGFC